MGNFEAEYLDGQPHWVYYETGDSAARGDPDQQTRIVFGPDLPSAEVELSKRYISLNDPDDDQD